MPRAIALTLTNGATFTSQTFFLSASMAAAQGARGTPTLNVAAYFVDYITLQQ